MSYCKLIDNVLVRQVYIDGKHALEFKSLTATWTRNKSEFYGQLPALDSDTVKVQVQEYLRHHPKPPEWCRIIEPVPHKPPIIASQRPGSEYMFMESQTGAGPYAKVRVTMQGKLNAVPLKAAEQLYELLDRELDKPWVKVVKAASGACLLVMKEEKPELATPYAIKVVTMFDTASKVTPAIWPEAWHYFASPVARDAFFDTYEWSFELEKLVSYAKKHSPVGRRITPNWAYMHDRNTVVYKTEAGILMRSHNQSKLI